MSAPGQAAGLGRGSANEAAVGDVLDNLKSFRHNFWAPGLLGFIMLFDSWDSVAMALVAPSIAREWSLDPLSLGFLISASYAGQFVGAVSLGYFAERLGRLPVLIVAVIVMCLLAIGCALAWDFTSLFIMRLIQGIMIGGAMPVSITYVNELAPTHWRGRYFGIFQTLAISGFSIAAMVSPLIIPTLGWRWMMGIGAIPLVLVPLMWLTLAESPRWLARIGRLEDANRSLIKLGGRPAVFPADPEQDISTKPSQERRAQLTDLFSPGLRFKTITVTMLWFLTMFVSFGLTTWAPSLFVQVYDIPEVTAYYYISLSSITLLVALASAGFIIDWIGRRPFAILGMSMSFLILTSIAIFDPRQELVIVCAILIGKIFIFFGTYTLWPYTAESFPTNVRALALGYASSIGRAASVITPIFVGWVLNEGAPIGIVFGVFGACALVALVNWLWRTSETVGKRLETV